MNELISDILQLREGSDSSSRSRVPLALNHPRHIQLTIGQNAPPETQAILSSQQSIFNQSRLDLISVNSS